VILREPYIPLVAFCLRHFLADFIICMCEFDFRQAQPPFVDDKDSKFRFVGGRPRRKARHRLY
jgi:hypothetical protein